MAGRLHMAAIPQAFLENVRIFVMCNLCEKQLWHLDPGLTPAARWMAFLIDD